MGLPKADRDSRDWFVYRLRCPITKRVRYIGISTNLKGRKAQHSSPVDEGDKKQWVKWLKSQGQKPLFEVISLGMTRDRARSWEVLLTFMFDRLYPKQLVGKEMVVFRRTTRTFLELSPVSRKKNFSH